MNKNSFIHQLKQLQGAHWQAVIEGQALVMIDDVRLEIGPAQAPNAIIFSAQQNSPDATALMQESLANATTILSNYYQSHPLTMAGFNQQVEKLMAEYGAAAFTAVAGQLAQRTLFVDQGEVIAESADSPRYRYGVFCELASPLAASALEKHVRKWLEQGEAYEHYLSMNVCRYNC
ncbi:MAG: hypothetical protein ACN4GM_09900 [Gammaproteobacteria bacterium]